MKVVFTGKLEFEIKKHDEMKDYAMNDTDKRQSTTIIVMPKESKYDFVNAHINNISFPKTIEQLEGFIYEHGCYNVEDVINGSKDGYTNWTVPRSSVVGDIVLYFHAKTAIQWIRKLETATKTLNTEFHDKKLLVEWLQRARRLYSLYGGKIFAIGRVSSRPEREDDVNLYHWSGRVYADIKDLYLLETPIDISEFNSFIMISRQSAITPLPSKEFEKLKVLVKAKNSNVPKWFLESKIGDNKLSKVNENNFLEITGSYRKRFPLEINFRSYYVDYFLKTLSGKKVYRECQCYTVKTPLARVDNVFEFRGKKILLEVKLNIALENDLSSQLAQYIHAEYIYLSNAQHDIITDFEKEFMFVIDVYAVYRYDVKNKKLVKMFDLDGIKNKGDIIVNMRNAIIYR